MHYLGAVLFWMLAIFVSGYTVALAAPPKGDPYGAEFDPRKILSIDVSLRQLVKRGHLPGGSRLILRSGKVGL